MVTNQLLNALNTCNNTNVQNITNDESSFYFNAYFEIKPVVGELGLAEYSFLGIRPAR